MSLFGASPPVVLCGIECGFLFTKECTHLTCSAFCKGVGGTAPLIVTGRINMYTSNYYDSTTIISSVLKQLLKNIFNTLHIVDLPKHEQYSQTGYLYYKH